MNRSLYFVAIMPDERLKGVLEEIQLEFSRKYHCKAALKTPIHVTLVPPFYSDAENLGRVAKDMSVWLRSFEPFTIQLNNFGFFPKNKVVFVNVELCPKLAELQFRLEELMVLHYGSSIKRYPSYHPHVTIGRKDIPGELYPAAMREYGSRLFSAEWFCTGVTVLRHDGTRWCREWEVELGVK